MTGGGGGGESFLNVHATMHADTPESGQVEPASGSIASILLQEVEQGAAAVQTVLK